jgi:hypothetical protein
VNARKIVAAAVVLTLGPAIVGSAVAPPFEDRPVMLWLHGAVPLTAAVVFWWAARELDNQADRPEMAGAAA